MRQSKYVIYTEYKKHLDGDWRTVHNLWRHIRNYAGVFGYSKVEVDAFFEGESGGKKQVDFGNVIGLTQSSIPYAAAGGELTEDNANFNYVAGTKTLSVDTLAFTGGSITDSSNLITFGDDVALTEGEGLAVGGTPVADSIKVETSDTDDPFLCLKNTNTAGASVAHEVHLALDESAAADHVDFIGWTAGVDTYFHVVGKAGQTAKLGVQIGAYRGELICGSAGHVSLKNVAEDKDLIFGIDDGGVSKTIKWDASADILIHSAGTFNIQGLIAMDTAVATAISIGNSFTGSQVTFIGSSATDHAIEISGLYNAALIYTHTSSGTADTLLWGDMASTATAGDFNGLRPRLTCNAASGGLNARAVYAEVIVGASKYAALAQGVLAHVSYAAGSCEITDIHALGVHITQGASLTATNLYGLIITVQTRGDETITGDDYMIRLNNEAVGGNGRQMDGAIQIVDTNLGGAIIGYGYGIDMNGATIATAELRFQNGETIDNLVDGIVNVGGKLRVTENSDTLTFSHDGTDPFIKWSDGILKLETDEGTNTTSYVAIRGKGTGIGAIRLYDEDNAEYFEFFSYAGHGYFNTGGVSPGQVRFQYNIAQNITFWDSISSGNPSFYLFGYKNAVGVKYLSFQIDNTGSAIINAQQSIFFKPWGATKIIISSAGWSLYDDYLTRFGTGADYSMGYHAGTDTLQIVNDSTLNASIRLQIDSAGIVAMPEVYGHDINGETYRDLLINDSGELGYDSSSLRHKMNIIEMEDTSWLYDLHPVNFEFKKAPGKKQYGLIAEDVVKLCPELVFYDNKNRPEGLHKRDFIFPIINELKKLKARTAELEDQLEQMEV